MTQPTRATHAKTAHPASAATAAPADPLWSHLPAPSADLAGVVVIPACNEAASIGAALQALLPQIAAAPRRFELLVLANNCRDRTAEIVREIAVRHGAGFVQVAEATLEGPLASAGHARRLLMEQAALRLRGAPDGLILGTDADTRADPDWLAATLHEFDLGADAVGGRILTLADPAQPAGIVHLQRLDTAYRLLRAKLEGAVDPDPADPWPRHHQHFGASLAVRASALALVGGPPHVPHLEDEALVAALRREDRRVRHSPAVRVWTSGRLDGRAEVGLSWQLRCWQDCIDAGERPHVPDPQRELAVWRWRRALRVAWRAAQDGQSRTSHALPVPPDGIAIDALATGGSLTESIRSATSFGRLWESLGGTRPIAGDAVPLDRAIDLLSRLLGVAPVADPVRVSRPGTRRAARPSSTSPMPRPSS